MTPVAAEQQEKVLGGLRVVLGNERVGNNYIPSFAPGGNSEAGGF